MVVPFAKLTTTKEVILTSEIDQLFTIISINQKEFYVITVDIPASFVWNDANLKWIKNYLMPKTPLLLTLTNGTGLDLNNISEARFKQFCELLEATAEGRELRNKMFKAWRSKKSRDSDNGKKMYTFNLSIDAGIQLKKIAKDAPINKTLEALIFAGKNKTKDSDKYQVQIKQLTSENNKLETQINEIRIENNSLKQESNIETDQQVNELAKLEKSQLIKQILLLKRKIKSQ